MTANTFELSTFSNGAALSLISRYEGWGYKKVGIRRDVENDMIWVAFTAPKGK